MTMIRSSAFRLVMLVLMALVLVFSCSDSGDKRGAVKDELGEPDDIIKSEYAGMKAELYVYARKDINRTYEFRKTTGGCGGDGDWYVYRMYYTNYLFPNIELYLPPTIKHEPVLTAPPEVRLSVSAIITDDVEVVSVTIFYRVKGIDDFQSTRMTGGEDDIYNAMIPAEFVTTAGLEYYIEANDGSYSTTLPAKGAFSVTVAEGGQLETGELVESKRPAVIPVFHSPDNMSGDSSPVSP